MNYETLDQTLQGRNKNRRKLDNNTYALRHGNDIAIRLHATDILSFSGQDGTVTVNTGGWQTVTTKDRLNKFLPPPYGIAQQKGLWYWCNGPEKVGIFTDGDKIVGGKLVKQCKDNGTTNLKLRARINEYAKAFANALPVDQPGAGDCFYCSMRDENGKPVGGTDHLLAHIKEHYFVPSLLASAFKEFGVSQMVGAAAFKQKEPVSEMWIGFAKDTAKKTLRRYLYRRLGLPT